MKMMILKQCDSPLAALSLYLNQFIHHKLKMMICNHSLLFLCIIFSSFGFSTIFASTSSDNLQDLCPAAPPLGPRQPGNFFINGLPCKKPGDVVPSDFKTSKLNHPGEMDFFTRSSMKILTALDFPGLNTLSLSVARTDIDAIGLSMPHYHPRAAEIMFVISGSVLVGFVDTEKQLFKKVLNDGDVFVFPQGLVHFVGNIGVDSATVFSVMNSQNPGVVSIDGDGIFAGSCSTESGEQLLNKLRSLHGDGEEVTNYVENMSCQA